MIVKHTLWLINRHDQNSISNKFSGSLKEKVKLKLNLRNDPSHSKLPQSGHLHILGTVWLTDKSPALENILTTEKKSNYKQQMGGKKTFKNSTATHLYQHNLWIAGGNSHMFPSFSKLSALLLTVFSFKLATQSITATYHGHNQSVVIFTANMWYCKQWNFTTTSWMQWFSVVILLLFKHLWINAPTSNHITMKESNFDQI